jgi:hypothetical protein
MLKKFQSCTEVRHKSVALSVCEAELNAAVLCVQDKLYGRNLLELMGLKVETPMLLKWTTRELYTLSTVLVLGEERVILT